MEEKQEYIVEVGTKHSVVLRKEDLDWLFGANFLEARLDNENLSPRQRQRLLWLVANGAHYSIGSEYNDARFAARITGPEDLPPLKKRSESYWNYYSKARENFEVSVNKDDALNFIDSLEDREVMTTRLRGFPDFATEQIMDTYEHDEPRNAVMRRAIYDFNSIVSEGRISESIATDLYEHLINKHFTVEVVGKQKIGTYEIINLRDYLPFGHEYREEDSNGFRVLSNEEWVKYFSKHFVKAKLEVAYLDDTYPWEIAKKIHFKKGRSEADLEYSLKRTSFLLPRTEEGRRLGPSMIDADYSSYDEYKKGAYGDLAMFYNTFGKEMSHSRVPLSIEEITP